MLLHNLVAALTSKTIQIAIDQDNTARSIKAMIKESKGIPASQQQLLLAGKKLKVSDAFFFFPHTSLISRVSRTAQRSRPTSPNKSRIELLLVIRLSGGGQKGLESFCGALPLRMPATNSPPLAGPSNPCKRTLTWADEGKANSIEDEEVQVLKKNKGGWRKEKKKGKTGEKLAAALADNAPPQLPLKRNKGKARAVLPSPSPPPSPPLPLVAKNKDKNADARAEMPAQGTSYEISLAKFLAVLFSTKSENVMDTVELNYLSVVESVLTLSTAQVLAATNFLVVAIASALQGQVRRYMSAARTKWLFEQVGSPEEDAPKLLPPLLRTLVPEHLRGQKLLQDLAEGPGGEGLIARQEHARAKRDIRLLERKDKEGERELPPGLHLRHLLGVPSGAPQSAHFLESSAFTVASAPPPPPLWRTVVQDDGTFKIVAPRQYVSVNWQKFGGIRKFGPCKDGVTGLQLL
ncbi:hypothetical protein JCM11251_000023 [Rhodosporidiobolus azoricus]